MPKFSTDWFTHNQKDFDMCLNQAKPIERYLEIGCFEGRSACHVIQKHLTSTGHIVCIDNFYGGQEHDSVDFNQVYETFLENIREVLNGSMRTYEVIGTTSHQALTMLNARDEEGFDAIYIDGSHTARDVLMDSIMSWPLLKQGGVMIWDDYLWDDVEGVYNQPKLGIDAFLDVFQDRIEIIHNGYQVGIKKR